MLVAFLAVGPISYWLTLVGWSEVDWIDAAAVATLATTSVVPCLAVATSVSCLAWEKAGLVAIAGVVAMGLILIYTVPNAYEFAAARPWQFNPDVTAMHLAAKLAAVTTPLSVAVGLPVGIAMALSRDGRV